MTKLQTLFNEDVNNLKLKYNFVREMLIEAPFKLQYKLRKFKSSRIFQQSETELFRNHRRNFSYPCLYLLTDANKRNGKGNVVKFAHRNQKNRIFTAGLLILASDMHLFKARRSCYLNYLR